MNSELVECPRCGSELVFNLAPRQRQRNTFTHKEWQCTGCTYWRN